MNTSSRTSVVRSLTLVAASLACTALGGCLIGSTTQTETSGHQIGNDTLAQIQAGKDMSYVTALIGDPTNKTVLDGGTEIWKWRYTERKNSSGTVIFLLSADNKTETSNTTYVEFKDGVVVKAWRD
jgi:outer membrane protein assembly factor BamE (lipoprotein component of BamABCDE complex)